MRKRSRIFAGLVVIVAVAAGTASSPAFADTVDYETALQAGVAIPLASASTTEAKKVETAALADGVSTADFQSMLTEGTWVGYPVATVLAEADDPAADGSAVAAAASVSSVAATADDGDYSGTAIFDSTYYAASDIWCYNGNGPTVTVYAKNVIGKVVWSYSVGEAYCWNKSTKTITGYDNSPYVNHKIPLWSQALGWSWAGQDLSGAKGPAYYTWGSKAHGGLQTWRKGEFKYSPYKIPIGSLSLFPWVHLYEHGDGTFRYSAGK